jgi:ATP-grasp domain, R2K clade family 2
MSMKALIQRRDGIPATEGCYTAWKAMSDAGWEIRFFEKIADVDVHENEVVVGGLDPLVQALTRLGVDLPDLDYPGTFREVLLDPNFERTTMGAVRRSTDRWPRFVKPTSGRKEFGGLVIRSTRDLLLVTHVDDELPVYSASPLEMTGRVEWRCFIVNGRVRDMRPYTACPDGDAPSRTFVQLLVDQWSSAPAGFTIDVVNIGSRTHPDWRIVECNDGYALGSYGFHRADYAELLVTRWAQLTGAPLAWP